MIWAPKTGASSTAGAVCAWTVPNSSNPSVLAIKMRFFMTVSLTRMNRSDFQPNDGDHLH